MGLKLRAQLKSTLVPGAGPLPSSFTRNLAAYVTDFEGLLKLVPANCARFTGARFVQNVFLHSEDFTGADWSKQAAGTGSVPVVTSGFSINYNGKAYNACRVVFAINGGTTTNDRSALQANPLPTSARARVMSFILQSNTASSYVIGLRVGTTGSRIVTVTPTPQRFSVSATADGDATTWIACRGGLVPVNSDSADILITAAQFEFTDGQSNQNPSEYVPIGTGLVFPFNGPGADGCRFFETQNGNTVNGTTFIVTEATGAAIAAATLRRYRKERAALNSCLQSTAFDDATWTKSGSGVALAPVVTANFAVAPDGTTTADRIQFDLNGGTTTGDISNLTQSFIYTNGLPFTFAVWLKSNTGGNQTMALVVFNSQSGNITVTPQWQRFVHVVTPNASVGSTFGLRVRGGQGMTTPADISAWGGYHEQMTGVPTSDIPTTTVPVTRPEDLLFFPISVYSDAAGTASALAEPDEWTGVGVNNRRVIGGGAQGEAGTPLFGSVAGGFGSYDVTIATPTTGGTPTGAARGAATWIAGGNKKAYLNGVPVNAGNAYDGSYNITAIGIGVGGSLPWQGNIGEVEMFDEALSDTDVARLPEYFLPVTTASVAVNFPAWSIRKNWRLALDTLPVVAAFSDWLVRDVRPDPDYVISADSRTRSISGTRTRSISR
jgi:hypothetical protein